MNIKQGEIYLVNFDPSFGHEYRKMRPALVVESNNFIPLGNLITVIPISSKTEKETPLDVLIIKDNTNRLLVDSLIKVRQISSFDKQRLVKRIGVCSTEVLIKTKQNIDSFLE